MKTHINLLAPDLLGEDRLPFQKVALPGAFFLLTLSILAATGVEWGRSQSLKHEIANLNERRAQVVQSLVGLRSETETIFRRGGAAGEADAAKDRLMRELNQERIHWASLLQEISVLIPDDVWLTSMEGLGDTKGENPTREHSNAENSPVTIQSVKEVKFEGFAVSHMAITQMMSALERSRYFKNAQLMKAEKTSNAGQIKVIFEIKAVLRQGSGNG